MPRIAYIVTVALVLAAALAQPAAADEAALLAVLNKPGASRKEKSDACRELAHQATKRSVPVLAKLLGDPEMAHMARYALETINDPAVEAALREAAGRLKGRPLVGVIGSLGVRRDRQAVGLIAALLDDKDVEVARAAARALGDIADAQAAAALTAAVDKAPADRLRAVCEGLLRCAESARDAGRTAAAADIYARLRRLPDPPHQVRTAAIRGALLTAGPKAPELLDAALGAADYGAFSAAARAAMEMPGQAVTAVLARRLGAAAPERVILLAGVLAVRGDASAGAALVAAAKNKGPAEARIAAIRAVTRLGYAPAVAALTEIALGGEAKVAEAAQKCLASFPGEAGAAAVRGLLDHADPRARRLGVEMIGRRAVAATTPLLLKAAGDGDAEVRAAAMRVLRETARAEDLPALLGLLMKAPTEGDIAAAEDALRALTAREARIGGGKVVIRKAVYGDFASGKVADVTRKVARLVRKGAASVEASNTLFGDPAHGIPKKLRVDFTLDGAPRSVTVNEKETLTFAGKTAPPQFVAAFREALGKAPSAVRPALVRVLRSAGGAEALAAVRQAVDSSDAALSEAAFRAVCEWSGPEALPVVADLAKTATSPVRKVLALRAMIRLAGMQAGGPAKQVADLKAALALADRDDERRLALSALSNIAAVEALEAIAPLLERGSLKEEACVAAVAVAERLKNRTGRVAEILRKVAATTKNARLASRARALGGRR